MKLIEDINEPEQIDKHHVEIVDEFLTPEDLKAIQAFLKVFLKAAYEPDETTIEELAQTLHEAGREAVIKGKLVNNTGKPFLEWNEISKDAKEGRRIQARYLLNHYYLFLR